MRILVACDFPDFALEELRSLGADVACEPQLTGDELAKSLDDVTILVVAERRIAPEIFAAGETLQMIVQRGTDVSNIAIDEASAAGVFVTNCPNTGAVAAAELALGSLIALDRQIPARCADLRQGSPRPGGPITALGLAGRTLGILGFGPIGEQVAPRAAAFQMRVIAHAESLTPEMARRHGVEFCARPTDLARRCDMAMVFAPPESCDTVLLDAAFISALRENPMVVFIGHPSALDERALLEAVEERGLRLAIDARPSQAVGNSVHFKSKLLELPGVIGTRSLWNRTIQARNASAREVVRIVQHFLVTGEALNCVNLMSRSPATWQLVLRLRDVVGVMASVMDAIRADGINAEEISSRVFQGARAAWCLVALDERPSTDALDSIAAIEGVLNLELRAMV